MSDPDVINVTKTFMPPLEEYQGYLEKIWANSRLTNHGPLVTELEQKLKEFLGVKHLWFVANGTVALQIAIKALSIKGKVITTPYSYVATTSSLVWEGKEPVYADIHPQSYNIDPLNIRRNIDAETSAILATHVYGNPCAVEDIAALAEEHGLKVIYDGAHCFGTRYQGESIYKCGDISTVSFHATKIFHTGEGGAVITNDDDLAHKLSYLRNFGHNGQENFWGLGINGKNSELHAALGLCNLKYIPQILKSYESSHHVYRDSLRDLPLGLQSIRDNTEYNHAYFPVVFRSGEIMLKVRDHLAGHSIYPRRYFYPSLTSLPYVERQVAAHADDIASRVLCLPLYHGMREEDVNRIVDLMKEVL